MKNVVKIDAENFVHASTANWFVIILESADNSIWTWNGNNFDRIADGHQHVSIFRPDETAKQYYRALNSCRSNDYPSPFEEPMNLQIWELSQMAHS